MRTRLVLARVAVLTAVAVPLLGCSSKPDADPWADAGGKPKVVASFAPIWCFAANVAGPDAVVKPLMTTQGPHHFDGTATEARLFAGADLVFVNGLGLDDKRVKKLVAGARNAKLKTVDLGGKLDPKTLLAASDCGCNHDHGDDDDHDHGGPDAHVWLGPDNAVKMAEAVRDALKTADPAHAAGYDARTAAFAGQLAALKADGKALLKDKTDRKFVTFHGALGYFAQAFDLKIAAVVQQTPGKDPTAKELDALVKLCVAEKVRVIAVEPQYTTQTSAQRIVSELKLKGVPDPVLVAIDPLETANDADLTPEWYVAKMKANLGELAKALK